MKNKAIRLAAVAASVLLGLGTSAFAQDVTIDFTGVENYSVQALGAYAGFYSGTVNGVASTPGFICDDYNNDIFLPTESWQAAATSFASLASGGAVDMTTLDGTLFGKNIGLAGYAAIANLANQMAMTTSVSLQADISAAIWYIGSVNSSSMVPWGKLDSGAQSLVNDMIGLYGSFGSASDSDLAAISELEGSSLWIYTPTGEGITPVGDPFPQEFIGSVPVPEGGAALMYLLLAGASCFGAMFFNTRRQIAKQVAA